MNISSPRTFSYSGLPALAPDMRCLRPVRVASFRTALRNLQVFAATPAAACLPLGQRGARGHRSGCSASNAARAPVVASRRAYASVSVSLRARAAISQHAARPNLPRPSCPATRYLLRPCARGCEHERAESLRHAKAHCRWRRRRPVARMAPKARAPRFGSVACASRAERLHFVRRKQARRLRQGPGRLCRLLTCCKTYARASS